MVNFCQQNFAKAFLNSLDKQGVHQFGGELPEKKKWRKLEDRKAVEKVSKKQEPEHKNADGSSGVVAAKAWNDAKWLQIATFRATKEREK